MDQLNNIWNVRISPKNLTACALAFLIGLLIGIFMSPSSPNISALVHAPSSVQDCYKQSAHLAGIQQPDIKTQLEIRGLCLQSIGDQGLLNDFQLRRMTYFQQAYQAQVILWIVVIITLSGVMLAAIQLAASYILATKGSAFVENMPQEKTRNTETGGEKAKPWNFVDENRLEFTKDRVIIQSSITGLMILIVSFAFFFVFVTKIYTQTESDPDKGPTQTNGNQPLTLLPGGAGGAPVSKPTSLGK